MAQSDHKTAESSKQRRARHAFRGESGVGGDYRARQWCARRSIGGDSGAKAGHPESGSRADGWTGEERSFRCPVLRGFDPGRRYPRRRSTCPIITLVSDEAFWLKVSLDEAQGLLDHRGLTDAGCIQRESQGNSLCINHKLHLGSFTFARQTNRGSSALGRGKSGIHKALFQVDSTLFDQLTDNGSKDTPERIGLTPRLQIVVHCALGRKGSRQVLPLDSGV